MQVQARRRYADLESTESKSKYLDDNAKAKTGVGTNFSQAENETEAKYQADGDKNLGFPYQAETKEDKAKYQDKTGAVTDLCQAEKETEAKHQADANKNLCLQYQAKTGTGTDSCRAENKTEASNLCLQYQDKNKEDKAQYQAETGAVVTVHLVDVPLRGSLELLFLSHPGEHLFSVRSLE